MTEPRLENDHQVPLKGRVGYFCGSLCTGFQIAIPTFLIFYGTQNLAISIGALSLMMAIVKVLDAFTDIIAGFIVDKTRHHTGKARPWLLWMALPYAVCFTLEFCIPTSWGPTAKLLSLAVMYALTVSVFGTMLGVATTALLPRLTSSIQERRALGVVCGGGGVTMVGFLMAIVFPLQARFGFQLVFGAFAVISFILCVLCYALVREQDITNYVAGKKSQAVSIKELVNTLIHNHYALMQFVYILIVQTGGAMIQGCGTYYATYVMGNADLYSQFMLAGAFGSLAGMFIGLPLVKRLGSKKLYCLGCLMLVAGFVVIALSRRSSPALIVVMFFFILMGGQVFTNSQNAVLAAAAVDYGEWKNGVRTEGVTACLGNVGSKVGGALGTAIMGAYLAAHGFAEGGVQQSVEAVNAIEFTFIGLTPIIYFILFLIFAITYRLEKQLPAIHRDLAERRAKAMN